MLRLARARPTTRARWGPLHWTCWFGKRKRSALKRRTMPLPNDCSTSKRFWTKRKWTRSGWTTSSTSDRLRRCPTPSKAKTACKCSPQCAKWKVRRPASSWTSTRRNSRSKNNNRTSNKSNRIPSSRTTLRRRSPRKTQTTTRSKRSEMAINWPAVSAPCNNTC